MARGRMISKSWSTSKKRAAIYRMGGPLSEFALQLFPLLVAHSDDYGRLDGDPETVKMVCDPCAPRPVDDFESALALMEKVNLIQRYAVDGATWLQIVKFDTHQPGMLSKRSESKSPAPPIDTELPGNSVLIKRNLTELNLTQTSVSSALLAEPAVLVFPTVGSGPTSWALTDRQVSEWSRLFPGLDVLRECREALAWAEANTSKRKTSRGMPAFLVRWLTRSTDRGGSKSTQTEKPFTAAELSEAKRIRANWFGRCRHDPPCVNGAACEATIIREKRQHRHGAA